MQLSKFEIEDYRRIDKCEIVLNANKPRLLPSTDLNGSGKTTVFEAISCLERIDKDSSPQSETILRIQSEYWDALKTGRENNKGIYMRNTNELFEAQ